jgi:hypothetical protein
MRRRSRGMRCPSRVLKRRPQHREGAGKAGCRLTPAARLQQRKQAAVTTGSTGSTGLPCAMAYGLYALSSGTGSLAPVSRHARSAHCAGRQHRDARTTRLRRPRPAVRRRVKHTLRQVAAIASRLACRDDRDMPLLPRQDNAYKHDFRKSEREIFSSQGLEHPHRFERASEISVSAHVVPSSSECGPGFRRHYIRLLSE